MTKNQPKSVYVLAGKDAHLVQSAKKDLIKNILAGADPQLCLSEFDSSVELSTILDELRTLPFLAPHRLVVITDASSFITANRSAIEKYLQSPSSTGTLVLIVSTWNKSTKLAKMLPKVGKVIQCDPPTGKDLTKWISDYAKSLGKKINPDAADMLSVSIGSDLSWLKNELDKLATYTNDRPAITAQDVTKIVSASAAPEAFALSNAITAGNIAKALDSLSNAMTTRGAEFALLGQLAWHLRRALQVQQAIETGANEYSAMKSARVFYGQREFLAMLRRRPRKKLQQDMRKLIAADLNMKSGSHPKTAMQQLIIELCT